MCKSAVCGCRKKRLMDWIMQTLTQLGEHFGLVLIACVELAAAVARVSERAKVYRKHRKSSWFLQRQKQFCVCGICVIFVVLSYTVKWE